MIRQTVSKNECKSKIILHIRPHQYETVFTAVKTSTTVVAAFVCQTSACYKFRQFALNYVVPSYSICILMKHLDRFTCPKTNRHHHYERKLKRQADVGVPRGF